MNQPQDNDQSKKVIRNYFIIAGLFTLSASVIWGVNTLFLLDAGLDILDVFIANAVFTGSMAVFEIPTGVLADTRGRRTSFLLSVIVIFIGTLGYVGAAETGGNLLFFCLMSAVLGLGYTFYSGAVEAWLVDALKTTGYSGQLDQVFARGSMVTGAAMLVGTISGGLLGSIDLSIPYLARSGLLAGACVVAYFTMHDIGFTPQTREENTMLPEMKRIAQESIIHGWKKISVRLLIIAALIQSIFMMWGFYAWQPYFLELLKKDLPWVAGVVAALIALSSIAGNSLVNWITRYRGKRTTLLMWAACIQTLAVIGVGLAGSFWLAVPIYLISCVAMGFWGPVRQAYIHQNIPSEHRASVISFDSLVSSGGSMFGQIGLGRIAQTHSIAAGYVTGGIVSVMVLPVVFLLRRLGDPADIIEGTSGKSSGSKSKSN